MRLYHKGASDETVARLGPEFVQQVESWEGAGNTHRFAAIRETFFTLNPFPQCSADCCSCLGLQHSYQEVLAVSLSIRILY